MLPPAPALPVARVRPNARPILPALKAFPTPPSKQPALQQYPVYTLDLEDPVKPNLQQIQPLFDQY